MAYSTFCVVLYLDEKQCNVNQVLKVLLCAFQFFKWKSLTSFPNKHERVRICMNAGNISVSLMPYQSYGCWSFNLCGYLTLFYSATFTITVTPITVTVTVCYS